MENIKEQKRRLKLFRLSKNFTPAAMAGILDIDEKTYYGYEAPGNDRFLSDKKIEALIKGTNMRREWLLTGEEPMMQGQETKTLVIPAKSIEQSLELPVPENASKLTIILRWD